MRRFFPFPLLVACLVLSAAAARAEELPPRISVTGEGRESFVPDMATITLGVTAEDADAGTAMDEVSESVRAILARLDEAGIAERDRQTSDLSLSPVWSNFTDNRGRREITGFQASNRVTVRVRALGDLGDVLAAVLEDGANQLGGLSFGLQEPRPVEDAARRAAVADALAKARLYAEAAGVALGPIRLISESGGAVPMPEMMLSARADAVPVAAGEGSVTARVTMVFEIAQ